MSSDLGSKLINFKIYRPKARQLGFIVGFNHKKTTIRSNLSKLL